MCMCNCGVVTGMASMTPQAPEFLTPAHYLRVRQLRHGQNLGLSISKVPVHVSGCLSAFSHNNKHKVRP